LVLNEDYMQPKHTLLSTANSNTPAPSRPKIIEWCQPYNPNTPRLGSLTAWRM